MRVARPKHKCLPNKFYLPLARTKQKFCRLKQSVRRSQFFLTEVTVAQLTTHRRFFAPGATEQFCDWRDQSIRFRRPNQKCPAPAIFLQQRWLKHEWPPNEKFLRLTRTKVFATGATEANVSADRIFFSIDKSEEQVTADRSIFSAWRDQKFLRVAWPKNKCPPNKV